MLGIDLGTRETAVNKSKSLIPEGLNSSAGEQHMNRFAGSVSDGDECHEDGYSRVRAERGGAILL